jgi:hypothetical protein
LGGIFVIKKIGMGLVAVFLFMSSRVLAAGSNNWQYVRDEAGNKVYLDTASINKSGNLFSMTEKQDLLNANNKGHASKLIFKEFDTKNKQWRTTGMEVLNAKGLKVVAQKKHGKWEKITAGSQAAADLQTCENYARLSGPWSYVKEIQTTASKFFNPSSLKKGKQDSLEVWEKLEMKKETGGVKTILSHVRYFVKTGKASTLYNCEFNTQGQLIKAGPVVDEWGVSNDAYGEYIGNDLEKYYSGHKK